MASDRESTEISLCGGSAILEIEGTIPYLYFNTSASMDSSMIFGSFPPLDAIYTMSIVSVFPPHNLSESCNNSLYIPRWIYDKNRDTGSLALLSSSCAETFLQFRARAEF
jgi:hypothetical protein